MRRPWESGIREAALGKGGGIREAAPERGGGDPRRDEAAPERGLEAVRGQGERGRRGLPPLPARSVPLCEGMGQPRGPGGPRARGALA